MEEQRTVGPDDVAGELVFAGHHRVGVESGGATGVLDADRTRLVDLCVAEQSAGAGDAGCATAVAPEHPEQVQPVAAEVHDGPAGEVVAPARIVGAGFGHAHDDVDVPDVTDGPGIEQFEGAFHHRMEQIVERLEHHQSVGTCRIADGSRLDRVARERFLGEYRLARGDRSQVPRGVQRVGQRVVDHLDLGVVDEGLIVVDDTLDTVLAREHLGPAAIAGGDRDQAVAQRVRRTDDGGLGDARRTEDADAQWLRMLRGAHTRTGRAAALRRNASETATSPAAASPSSSVVRMVSCSSTYQPV